MSDEEKPNEAPVLDTAAKAAIEAIVYVADEPVTADQIAAALENANPDLVRRMVETLVEEYRQEERGLEIREVAGGYKIFTKPEHHEVIRRFVKQLTPPFRLSLAALETLATIAYRQPVTLPEIQQIRGVNAAGVLKTLLEKKLITTAGRKNVLGRPILYRTTKEFLLQFGLNGLEELPRIEEFEELARAALGEKGSAAEHDGVSAGNLRQQPTAPGAVQPAESPSNVSSAPISAGSPPRGGESSDDA